MLQCCGTLAAAVRIKNRPMIVFLFVCFLSSSGAHSLLVLCHVSLPCCFGGILSFKQPQSAPTLASSKRHSLPLGVLSVP